jgi:uncharacterized membrane protein YfcA
MSPELLWIVAGGLIGGFINGLSGFGMAIVAMPLWLQALTPANAASMAAILAVIAHAQSISVVVHAINVKRVAPFIVGGIVGIPVGTWLLAGIDEATFRFATGAVIVVYCAVMLSGRVRVTVDAGALGDGIVGFGGGIMGALSGLSGALPAMWAGMRGWTKDERRAVFQPFNMSILAVTIVAHAVAGLFTSDLIWALAAGVPSVLIGSQTGKLLYHRLGDHHFDRIVLAVLLFSGVSLVVTTFTHG